MEEPSRRRLYARLEEVLGDEHAAALMRHLPAEQPAELATKADIGALGAATKADISSVRAEIRAVESRLEGRLDRVEERLDRLDDRMHDFQTALREQTKTFVISSVSTMVALAGACFTAGVLI
jgi:hypothetical protein